MRHSNVFVLFTSSILFLTACGEETNKNNDGTIANPVNSYLDSRVSAMELAKSSIKESNQRIETQNKNIDTLIHQ